MKNKIFITLLSILVLTELSALSAPSFFEKKGAVSICPKEKIEYVNINWWDNFSDPLLKRYIITAVEQNHEAKKAAWQVEEYKHFVKYQFSQELPSLSVGAKYIGLHVPESVTKDFDKNIFTVPFIASYEADIFLKNNDKTKSSKKAYEASQFQEKSIYISLASNVATAYLNAVKFDKQIQLQEEIVKSKKETLEQNSHRYQRGVITAQILNSSKADYEKAKNTLNEYEKARDKALTQLATLCGDSAENYKNYLRSDLNTIKFKSEIPKEISSSVLFSRPDILAQEAKLEKAKIDVRVARKEFLPTVDINGLYALSSLGGANFFSWQSAIAAIAAGMTQDLYTGGRKTANLKIMNTRYQQMFEDYKQTDLTAIKEVKDSLLIIDEDNKIEKNNLYQIALQSNNYKRAKDSFDEGTISNTQLETQKQQYLLTSQNEIESKVMLFTDYITLYKAVGGKL